MLNNYTQTYKALQARKSNWKRYDLETGTNPRLTLNTLVLVAFIALLFCLSAIR